MLASSVRPRMPGVTGSASLSMKEKARAIESLARRLVEGVTDQHLLQSARAVAYAHLELARIRQLKLDIIDCLARFEALRPAARFGRDVERRLLKALSGAPMKKLKPVDWLVPPLSQAELGRTNHFYCKFNVVGELSRSIYGQHGVDLAAFFPDNDNCAIANGKSGTEQF
jgi:hypothetical protein